MKKSYLSGSVIIITLLILIAGCKKENDNDPTINASVVGEWTCTAIDYTGTTVTEMSGQSLTTDFVGEGYDVDFTLTFTESPNNVTSDGSYSIKLTTTFYGQSTEQDIEGQSFSYTGTWSMSGSELSITQGGETSVATIQELTDSKLSIYIKDVQTLTNMGATATTTTEMNVSFTR